MAIVTKYSRAFQDPASFVLSKVAQAEGVMRAIMTGPIAIANGDSIGSRHYFGKIPSNGIILPFSTLYHEGVTSCNSYDIGIEHDGTIDDDNLLAAGLDITAVGTKSIVTTIGIVGTIGKPIWELLGLTLDPGRNYDIVGTMKAAATAAKNIEAAIYYSKQ